MVRLLGSLSLPLSASATLYPCSPIHSQLRTSGRTMPLPSAEGCGLVKSCATKGSGREKHREEWEARVVRHNFMGHDESRVSSPSHLAHFVYIVTDRFDTPIPTYNHPPTREIDTSPPPRMYHHCKIVKPPRRPRHVDHVTSTSMTTTPHDLDLDNPHHVDTSTMGTPSSTSTTPMTPHQPPSRRWPPHREHRLDHPCVDATSTSTPRHPDRATSTTPPRPLLRRAPHRRPRHVPTPP